MAATLYLTMSDLHAENLELTLSDRVAMANSWTGARRMDDGSLLIELEIHPIEMSSPLPRPHDERRPVASLLTAFLAGRTRSKVRRLRHVPRRPD